LGAHPGLRHRDGGPRTAGAKRISGRRKLHPEDPVEWPTEALEQPNDEDANIDDRCSIDLIYYHEQSVAEISDIVDAPEKPSERECSMRAGGSRNYLR